MNDLQLYKVEITCKLCKFNVEVKSTEKIILNTIDMIINHHNDLSKKCHATKDDFIIKYIPIISDTKKLILKRIEETKIMLRNSSIVEDYKFNDDIRDIIKIKLINYILYEERLKEIDKYITSGFILVGIPDIRIIHSILNEILLSNSSYEDKFNIIILHHQDFISTKAGETGYKIERVFNTLKELNKENNKHSLLIINNIDKIIPNRDNINNLLAIEKTSTLLGEFGGMYDNHTIFIIGITNRLSKIDKDALRPGRFGSPIIIDDQVNDVKKKEPIKEDELERFFK